MSATVAASLGTPYVLAAFIVSATLGYRTCVQSRGGGLGVRSHAVGLLTFLGSLIGAVVLLLSLALAGVLVLGAAM